jgi:hypothetical protein
MGNIFSSSNGPDPSEINIKGLTENINDIAVHYILKQNSIDLLRLTDKEYYDNLIILTSKILDSRLNNLEIGLINDKIKGETIGNAVFSLIPSTDKIKNKMISNIAKFYIKIITIYSAIVSTIDPQYSYQDEEGQVHFFYLKDIEAYKKIPKGVTPTLTNLTNPMNLCRKRLNILKHKLDISDPDIVTINPGQQLCDNMVESTNLSQEVGIRELDLLYYDIFDYNTKTWSKRSKKMDEVYKTDLTLFYKIFTGKNNRPSEIKSFKDIELLDFRTIKYCREDPFFKQELFISKQDERIQEYIKHIQLIEDSVTTHRSTLSEILSNIFIDKIVDGEKNYTINPSLTLDDIKILETRTRDTIINMYGDCEKSFIEALIIFEKIYEEKSNNIASKRLQTEQRYNTNNIIAPAVPIVTNLNTDSFTNLSKVNRPLYETPFNKSKEPLFQSPETIQTESINTEPQTIQPMTIPSEPITHNQPAYNNLPSEPITYNQPAYNNLPSENSKYIENDVERIVSNDENITQEVNQNYNNNLYEIEPEYNKNLNEEQNNNSDLIQNFPETIPRPIYQNNLETLQNTNDKQPPYTESYISPPIEYQKNQSYNESPVKNQLSSPQETDIKQTTEIPEQSSVQPIKNESFIDFVKKNITNLMPNSEKTNEITNPTIPKPTIVTTNKPIEPIIETTPRINQPTL